MVYCIAQLAMVAEPFAIERKRAVDASAAVAHGDIGKVVELAALTVIEQHADREVLAITAIAIPLAYKELAEALEAPVVAKRPTTKRVHIMG